MWNICHAGRVFPRYDTIWQNLLTRITSFLLLTRVTTKVTVGFRVARVGCPWYPLLTGFCVTVQQSLVVTKHTGIYKNRGNGPIHKTYLFWPTYVEFEYFVIYWIENLFNKNEQDRPFIPCLRHNSCRKRVCRMLFPHGCFDVSYTSWNKSKNPGLCRNCTFPNSMHHQNLETTWPVASCFPDHDDAHHLEMCDLGMGSCYIANNIHDLLKILKHMVLPMVYDFSSHEYDINYNFCGWRKCHHVTILDMTIQTLQFHVQYILFQHRHCFHNNNLLSCWVNSSYGINKCSNITRAAQVMLS